MNNYMKTIINGLLSYIHSYTKKARGNWNQNNSDAIDYIKNRPFYSETENVILFERTSITNFDYEDENVKIVLGTDNIELASNTEYFINCNGNNYTCKSQLIRDDIYFLGNLTLLAEEITSNDPPFLFMSDQKQFQLVFISTDVETYSFKITGPKETIVKIPEKYLPESKNSNILNGTGKGAVKTKYASQASGDYSFAEGYNTEASGDYSHTEGDRTEASGLCSHAEGDSTTASGEKSHAEGGNTQSDGWTSHAEGNWTIASGSGSHAEGSSTTASGLDSHAEGSSTIASGEVSHAEGYNTTASGNYSHAEGNYTEASGYYAHAEGCETEASGNYSHAEGGYTQANGNYSHAEGNHTIASGENQHVQGKYNIEDTENKYAHIVGNGTYNTRSNVHTLDWDGNAWFAGNIYIGGSGQETGMPLLSMTEITLSSNSWVNNQQEVIVNGVSANEIDLYILIIPVQLNQSNIEIITKCNIKAIGLKKDSIIFKCDKLPNSNVRFYIVIANIIWLGARPNLGVLTDFEYIKNADGTYTLTSWKGTLNGIPSDKMHIPNSSEIIF